MKLLIIGASGLLGQTLFKLASQQSDLEVYGMVRNRDARVLEFLQVTETRIFECDFESAVDPLLFCSPNVVINCTGIIKQQGTAQGALSYIRVNALALLHLYGEKISKYELLVLVKDIFYKTEITVRPDGNYICDRSLISSRLSGLGITLPSLRQMLIELRDFN